MGADVGPKDSTDWHVKCLPEQVEVCCGNLGMEFNMVEGTCYIIVEEQDASVLVRCLDVAHSD